MQTEQNITEVLDEAIQALAVLDLDKLERLEERVVTLAGSCRLGVSGDREAILAKKRLLAMLLQNCRSNLDVLRRLHGRNADDSWAH